MRYVADRTAGLGFKRFFGWLMELQPSSFEKAPKVVHLPVPTLAVTGLRCGGMHANVLRRKERVSEFSQRFASRQTSTIQVNSGRFVRELLVVQELPCACSSNDSALFQAVLKGELGGADTPQGTCPLRPGATRKVRIAYGLDEHCCSFCVQT
jgi:hypothetical protein